MTFWVVPFFLQGGAMLFDEFYFHHKRGLPKWERIGHPLDTLTFLACFVFLIFSPYSEQNLKTYAALSIFSCLFVTKDEFIHSQKCLPLEQWLHAVLFILHPIILATAAWLWMSENNSWLLKGQASFIFIFLGYQIFYWSRHHERN